MFLTALLAATLAAPVPKEKPVYYFPTTVGAKRVVESTLNGKTTEATEEVTKVEEKGGVFTVTVEWAGSRRPGAATYEVTDARVRQVGVKDLGEFTLLDLGVKAGESWTREWAIDGTKVVTTFTLGKEEVVVVPAGKFKAVPVTEHSGRADEATTRWYAPGVGLVKSHYQSKEVKSTMVLKEFTPGKDAKK
jgi:hypothetical protein